MLGSGGCAKAKPWMVSFAIICPARGNNVGLELFAEMLFKKGL
jgi:hypothetical protein